MDLTPKDVDALLGAWALDALDPDEAAAIDAALAADPALRREAAALRAVVTALGDEVAAAPSAELRGEMLARVASMVRPALPATDPVTAYANQVEAMSELLTGLDADGWRQPALPYEWTVHGLVAHLLVIERYMAGQLGLAPAVEDGPSGHLQMGADQIAAELARRGPDTAASWHEAATAIIDALRRGAGPGLEAPVELHGWPFTVETLMIARAFEVWTHADDIRRATRQELDAPEPADLRSMSRFSVTTLPLVWPLVAPDATFTGARVVLTGDGGGTFDLGDPTTRDALVVADVVDYCRLAARRIATSDLDVVMEGDRETGERLLAAAQVFAV